MGTTLENPDRIDRLVVVDIAPVEYPLSLHSMTEMQQILQVFMEFIKSLTG